MTAAPVSAWIYICSIVPEERKDKTRLESYTRLASVMSWYLMVSCALSKHIAHRRWAMVDLDLCNYAFVLGWWWWCIRRVARVLHTAQRQQRQKKCV